MTIDLMIRMKVEDAKELWADSHRESKTCYMKGLPWSLRLWTVSSSGSLIVKVHCNWETEHVDWSCKWTAEIHIVNKDAAKSLTCEISDVSNEKNRARGFCFSDMWSDIIDENMGFIVDGAVTIEAHIRVHKVAGLRIATPIDFTKPIDNVSNVALRVDGKILHVSSQILSMSSPVFYSLFFGEFNETGKEVVEINEVEYDQFVDFLNIIYPTSIEIVVRTLPHITALADRFQVQSVLDKAETYLLDTKKFTILEKLALADKYRLNILQVRCLSSFVSVGNLLSLISNFVQYNFLTNDMKAAISDRLMELYRSNPFTHPNSIYQYQTFSNVSIGNLNN